MQIINVHELIAPLSAEAPCGVNLEYDPLFLELELAIAGKPEVQYGTSISAAVPPDWKLVKKIALELMNRTRDLRVAAALLRALLALDGFAGLADGLVLVKLLLSERWDSVFPELDADDDMDPTLRVNSLAVLAEFNTTLREVKDAQLIVLPSLGVLNIQRLEIEAGDVSVADDVKLVGIDAIRLAIADVDQQLASVALSQVREAMDAAVSIAAILTERVGASQTLNLDALIKNLKRGHDFLLAAIAQPNANDEIKESLADTAVLNEVSKVNLNKAMSDEISSRQDVVKMIEKLCVYYQRYEPSSPIPLVLLRAKKMVSMNFIEIMEEIASDGLNQVRQVVGYGLNKEE